MLVSHKCLRFFFYYYYYSLAWSLSHLLAIRLGSIRMIQWFSFSISLYRAVYHEPFLRWMSFVCVCHTRSACRLFFFSFRSVLSFVVMFFQQQKIIFKWAKIGWYVSAAWAGSQYVGFWYEVRQTHTHTDIHNNWIELFSFFIIICFFLIYLFQSEESLLVDSTFRSLQYTKDLTRALFSNLSWHTRT